MSGCRVRVSADAMPKLLSAPTTRISTDIVRQTFVTCDSVLASTGVAPGDLDAIFLAGGSTHLAGVRDGVQSYFGKPGRFELEPTEVVAMGASMVPASTGSSSIV